MTAVVGGRTAWSAMSRCVIAHEVLVVDAGATEQIALDTDPRPLDGVLGLRRVRLADLI